MRDKTADVLDRMEAAVRGVDEKKEAPKAEKKKETVTGKRGPKTAKKQ